MFLTKLAMSMVGLSPEELPKNESALENAKIVTDEYFRKQQWKHRLSRSSRNPCDNQFRAFLDLLSLCAATEYLTDGPSSRAPDAHPGTPCSMPGNWDFEYDGNEFHWRDAHHELGSAILWNSNTADHIVIAVKDKKTSHFVSNQFKFRMQGSYLKGAYIQPEIYKEAASLYESLESTGFLGTVRPWVKKNITAYEVDTRKNFGFVLTGHKTAGAVATVLAMILVEQGYIVREVVTFGAPKFLNEKAALKWDSKLHLTRIVNEGDITNQTPVSIIKSPFSENWAHFGREIMLKKSGNHTDDESNGINDSIIHQILIKGFGHVFDYWWTNGAAGEIHHPILYFDHNYKGHPTVDDFTDALLFCIYRMQTSKKLRTHHHVRVIHNQTPKKQKPSIMYLAAILLVRLMIYLLSSLAGMTMPSLSEDEAEPLSPISPALLKNVNFKRINVTTAFTWIYQDNIIYGNPKSPSTQLEYGVTKSPVESLYDAIDQHDQGMRCANCVLFRRNNFRKKDYGALIIHRTRVPKPQLSQQKTSSKVKAKSAKGSLRKNLEKETEEFLKQSKGFKEKMNKTGSTTAKQNNRPALSPQRNLMQAWARHMMLP